MPVDNDTGGGTQFTITHPRPTQPQSGDIAAAVATGVAAAIQLYSIFTGEGSASALQISALVATLVGLMVLIVTIVKDGVSQDITFDIPSDPAAWTSLSQHQTGAPLPKEIVPEDVILFRDPDISAGTKIQAAGGGVSDSSTTVHLAQTTRANASRNDFFCTYS
jgi:hypothetical protein